MGVHVWPWVLHFAGLQQNVWHDLVDLRDQLKHREVRQMLECELSLGDISWIGLSQNRMAIARHHSSRLEQRPNELFQLLVRHVGRSELFHHVGDEDQYFLVGQAVQRTGKTVDAGGERQVRIGKRGADQVSGVCRYVTTENVCD